YSWPEARRDRFRMMLWVGSPSDGQEREIVYRTGVSPPEPEVVFAPGDLVRLQRRCDQVFVPPALVDYAVRLVLATRSPAAYGLGDVAHLVQYGASPRASLGMVRAARAMAVLRGRDYALTADITDVAPDVLRHRLDRKS